MPRVEASVTVAVGSEVAFAVSQTTGDLRLRWDPFISEQHLLDGAARPGKGVRTQTRSRHGFTMISEYTAFRPPHQVGMRMVDGPWFFEKFGGGWTFTEQSDGGTVAVWRYTFTVKPAWLAPIANRVGVWLLRRDIRRRIDAFATACTTPDIVAAVTEHQT